MIRMPKKADNTKGKKSNPVAEQEEPAMKYPKPKILLVDVEDEAVKALQKAGWNAVSGTFGRPYRVEKGDGFMPVIVNYSLPNYSEQEIIVIDLCKKEIADGPEGEKHVPDGERDLWAKCNRGRIDPRVRAMLNVRDSFDKILQNDGVFIVFAECKIEQNLMFAINKYNELRNVEPFEADIWDFLTEFQHLRVMAADGLEIVPVTDNAIGNLLSEHLKDADYRCVLEYYPPWVSKTTKKIALNKFGETVGLVHSEDKGTIIVLPQISNKRQFLLKLLGELLPEVMPEFFPNLEEGRWVHRIEYELPKVIEFEAQKTEVEKKAKAEIDALAQEVTKERDLLGWMHDLLTGTDQTLVEAVKKALHVLGFQKVADVDAERDKAGKSRREDLQIHDQKPVLIVDIKGVGGLPGDAEALQADKHATIRMREWNITDVVPLSIINHQRHLPPLDRNNEMPFRQEILDHAEESKLGLITTWDLFRLVRSFQKNGWTPENVKPIFYRKGRINIIPNHYKLIGRVRHVWKAAFSIIIDDDELRVNDIIAFELTSEFEEREVASLQIEDNSVASAGAGNEVGVKLKTPQPALKKGMPVYLVQRENGQ